MITVAVREFFCEGMAKGWASGAKATEMPGLGPGFKGFIAESGGFRLVDAYCVNEESGKSAGSTTIWFRDLPVWVMGYGGWYSGEVGDFLKSALSDTYSRNVFMGGRGPVRMISDLYEYHNKVIMGNFIRFSGEERIYTGGGSGCLGYHDYWGMALW